MPGSHRSTIPPRGASSGSPSTRSPASAPGPESPSEAELPRRERCSDLRAALNACRSPGELRRPAAVVRDLSAEAVYAVGHALLDSVPAHRGSTPDGGAAVGARGGRLRQVLPGGGG